MKKPNLSAAQLRGLAALASAQSRWVCGIDEVGLGSFAGPLVVAAVVFRYDFEHADIKDSKAFTTHRKREEVLKRVVLPNAEETCLLFRTPEKIDEVGLGQSQRELTEGVALFMRQRFSTCLVVQDGQYLIPVDGDSRNVVCFPRADALVPAVSAASILAKVSRDRYMHKAAELFPGYGFESNVGYHTEAHRRGLETQGVCPLHRKSFRPVQKYL